jgi:hypothetical protein
VLPAAVSLRKQGATKGATTAFLISTPESGVDSIAVTYAMLDPVMTVARPVAAFFTAFVAGIAENLFGYRRAAAPAAPDLTCPVDGCCDGVNCDPQVHRNHHRFYEKLRAGIRFAVTDLWGDIAPWFFFGLLLAGLITVVIPDDFFSRHLGSGLPAMLLMLAVGIPLYICATASTPIAAALILKGVSPGVALVFLLAGPATNMASMTVLMGTLGKRATVIYLSAIAVCSVLMGWAVDQAYAAMGISARAAAGQAAAIVPGWLQWGAALLIVAISIQPTALKLKSLLEKKNPAEPPTSARLAATASVSPLSSAAPCCGATCGCAEAPAGDRRDQTR